MTQPPPVLVILGGINGAGKTTTAERLARLPELAHARFLNPDKVAERIRADDPVLRGPIVDLRGSRMIALEIGRLVAARRSFVTETVLAGQSYRRLCTRARAAGYRVKLYWIGVRSAEDAIARVAFRVAKGGHPIAPADIVRRWPMTHENLAWFCRHADEVDVLDNSAADEAPRLVATARRGRLTLLNPTALPEVTRVVGVLR